MLSIIWNIIWNKTWKDQNCRWGNDKGLETLFWFESLRWAFLREPFESCTSSASPSKESTEQKAIQLESKLGILPPCLWASMDKPNIINHKLAVRMDLKPHINCHSRPKLAPHRSAFWTCWHFRSLVPILRGETLSPAIFRSSPRKPEFRGAP